METCNLVVKYDVEHGKREAFLNEVIESGILDIIHGENGCVSYEYYRSVSNPDQLVLLETWASEDAQKIHMQQPHIAEFFKLKEKYKVVTDLKKASYK